MTHPATQPPSYPANLRKWWRRDRPAERRRDIVAEVGSTDGAAERRRDRSEDQQEHEPEPIAAGAFGPRRFEPGAHVRRDITGAPEELLRQPLLKGSHDGIERLADQEPHECANDPRNQSDARTAGDVQWRRLILLLEVGG